ncbi:MAG: hypothetical protein K2Y23_19055, partial [Cyanobacteria bacterium]|nr:hypothetical protein [Cyanobacteriota bacterium]
PVLLDPILDIVSAFRKVSTESDQCHSGLKAASGRSNSKSPERKQIDGCCGWGRNAENEAGSTRH